MWRDQLWEIIDQKRKVLAKTQRHTQKLINWKWLLPLPLSTSSHFPPIKFLEVKENHHPMTLLFLLLHCQHLICCPKDARSVEVKGPLIVLDVRLISSYNSILSLLALPSWFPVVVQCVTWHICIFYVVLQVINYSCYIPW